MRKKANVFLLSILTLLISAFITADAGVLQSLDEELTSLVKKTEPFLVTVEAEGFHHDMVRVGTGVLISKDGYILTTTSVADKDDDIRVFFKGGDSFPADFVGDDKHSGLVMLKIEPVNRETPKIGDPFGLDEGSWVTVIGNAYDMPTSVNFGIFSGITDEGLLQLSVQSNPGGSGGAVFNTKGEMVGLLVAKATETISLYLPSSRKAQIKAFSAGASRLGDFYGMNIDFPSTGTSLAIPADKMMKIADQLKKYGEVKHGFLGISQKELSKLRQRRFDFDGGVEVTDVSHGSPADKAGIVKGDIITMFAGIKVRGPGHLYSLVRSHQPDDKVTAEIYRDGSRKEIEVTLGEASDTGFFGGLGTPQLYSKFDRLESGFDLEKLGNKIKDLERRVDELSKTIEKLGQRLQK